MVTKFAAAAVSSSDLKKPTMVTVMYTFSQRYYQLPGLHIFLLLFLSTMSCSATQISYTNPCASIMPKSTPTSLDFSTSPFPPFQSGYYRGSDRILNPNSPDNSSNMLRTMWLRTDKVYKTDVGGLFKVEGSVTLRNLNVSNLPDYVYNTNVRGASLTIELQGFWSESSGSLCMVSSAPDWKEGNLPDSAVVLKLNHVKNSSIITSLVSGTLESVSSANDSNYFEPISIFVFTPMNYEYTLVSEEFGNGCSGGGSDISQSLEPQRSLCSTLSRPVDRLELKYTSDCNPSKNCSPFGGSIDYLPQVMSLNAIQCLDDDQMVRFLVEFSNTSFVGFERPLNPSTTLVGEGLWDGKKNQLCVVACPILNTTDSLANAHVGNCSIRLSLRFPAIWSIRDGSGIVGQIWSTKTVNDSGYFDRIMYRSSENRMAGAAGLKYEYTETDRVRKSCPAKKPVKNKEARYLNGYSSDMKFDMSVKDSKNRLIAQGFSVPLSVGDLFYDRYGYPIPVSSEMSLTNSLVPANSRNRWPLNISYKISFRLKPGVNVGASISLNMQEEISAEGIYDVKTGGLCMVGCRNVGSNNRTLTNDSMDCEILINFQFPPSNLKNEGLIKGSIESTRKKSDPLYFERLELSSTPFLRVIERKPISRIDLEITMVLISNTLGCVFVVLQIFYAKKHQVMIHFTSLVMLGILTLGYMIPLVLNLEALLLHNRNLQNFLFGSVSWIQVEEVILRAVIMVAFLLQFRLLQLTWSARLGDGSQKDLWAAEKKAFYMYLPLYVAGGLTALFVSGRRFNHDLLMISSSQHSFFGALKSYGGLVLDSFLLPQILLNILCNLKEKPLSCSFYVGTTFVRLLPHAYDLYRAHSYVIHIGRSYFYANPGADFYSTAWDVIIPCGGLLFASVIYFQQHFGGRCILPRRFRLSDKYEKVPVVINE